MDTVFDLSTLNLAPGSHTINVIGKAPNYRSSDPSNTIIYNIPAFVLNSDLYEDCDSALEDLMSDVYNQFTTEMWEGEDEGASRAIQIPGYWTYAELGVSGDYWINAGSLHSSVTVTGVSFDGETVYDNEDVFKLSIGQNNFVQDLVWKVSNGNLLIAAPILMMETALEHVIIINNDSYECPGSQAGTLTVEGMEWADGSQAVSSSSGNVYNIIKPSEDMALNIRLGELDVSSSDLITWMHCTKVDDTTTDSYAITSLTTLAGGKGVSLYPYFYGQGLTDPKSLIFEIYDPTADKQVEIVLNLEI